MLVPVWKVTALKMGDLVVDKSSLTYSKDLGKQVTIPIWAAAIENGDCKIIVDTGIHSQEWVNENITICMQADDETMIGALKKGVDWLPEDVDIVINTHLHYDHCGNNHLFKNAQFILQEEEWKNAFHSLPTQKQFYLRELYDCRAVNYFNWKFVTGEVEVAPGVKVFTTPGHTSGHQSVLVNTEEGVLCISADVANLVENINDNVPPNILNSTEQWFSSLDEIRQKAQLILPGHEPAIRKYQTSNFPAITSF
ncbi:N-acyl homoserine lactonase family protein [Petroclostridium sp. X23]|uniref:N-acyl homoserine lactonase family protein n=1 Tax=Petroclostridium sp. X23 TaxID=3045146 RepID=UPI0024AD768E|nr:N-acyl homoserine lactonase family protein [Petroclostridium sp. X23]WHH59037.1 N-acyl homoserine lactonase family protein [Petroclostridium sp. X23]